jgi:Lon protease-like protein
VSAAPQPLSLFPLHIVLFPGGPLPLRIFETRYVDMVRNCMRSASSFGVVLIRAGNEIGPAETFDVGTTASIVDFHQLSDGFLGLSCVGGQRFRIKTRSLQADGLNLAVVDPVPDEPALRVPQRHAGLSQLLESVLPQLGEGYANMTLKLDDAAWVGHRLAEILPIPVSQKQFCLELDDPIQRLEFLAPLALTPASSAPPSAPD